MISLSANSRALAPGCQAIFTGAGGVAPYTYSVLPGGADGSIDISTGVYTAPLALNENPLLNVDKIRVVDANNDEAELSVMVGSYLALVCDIIAKYMNLADDQLFIWDQKFNIPHDNRVYLSAAVMSSNVFGNSISYDEGAGLEAVQQTNIRDLVQIDIYSKSTESFRRRFEVIRALKSVYAQQQMAQNSFSISAIPTNVVTVNAQEGAAIPYRFNITVSLQYMETQSEEVAYFDEFEEPEITVENQGDES